MLPVRRHLSRCLVAGVVALLPVGGIVLAVASLESMIAQSWLREQGFYFFGCGLLLALAAIYLIGLVVSTFIGRWIWRLIDRALEQLPLLGNLYQTLKQILGYGEGPGAVFQRVVLVPARDYHGDELGLVTNDTSTADQRGQLTVFIPAAPTPTTGRLILISSENVRPLNISVSNALKQLVSLGKLPSA